MGTITKKSKMSTVGRQLAACAALTLAAASAQASLMGVKTIEISNSINTWLQVAEFQAFDTSSNNVALAATATSALGSSWNATSTPDKAIDGNTNGNFGAGSVYHEGNSGDRQGDTLIITLAAITELNSVTIFGRTDCCSDPRDIYNINFLDENGSSLFLISGLDASGSTHQASFQLPATSVPEPTPLALLSLGLLAMVWRRRAVKR